MPESAFTAARACSVNFRNSSSLGVLLALCTEDHRALSGLSLPQVFFFFFALFFP